jgi:2-deoxy-D-gluconate 3-dehydrogenase
LGVTAVGGHAITADVTTTGAVEEAHDALGGLTRVANIVGLVNMRPFLDTDPEFWAAQLQLNPYSHMLVCHAAGRHMVAEGGGAIAMVASVSGIYGAPTRSPGPSSSCCRICPLT